MTPMDNPTWPTGCHDPASCERTDKPFRMLISSERLMEKIMDDPDVDVEVGMEIALATTRRPVAQVALTDLPKQLRIDADELSGCGAGNEAEHVRQAADEIDRLASTLATIRRILATVPYPLGPYGALGEIDRALGRKSV